MLVYLRMEGFEYGFLLNKNLMVDENSIVYWSECSNSDLFLILKKFGVNIIIKKIFKINAINKENNENQDYIYDS